MSIRRHDIVLKLGPKDRKGIAARAEWRRVVLDFYPSDRLLHGVGSTIDGMGRARPEADLGRNRPSTPCR